MIGFGYVAFMRGYVAFVRDRQLPELARDIDRGT